MKKFIVVYESYTKYNQFDGSWDLQKESFSSREKAEKWIANTQKNFEVRKIEGPFVRC